MKRNIIIICLTVNLALWVSVLGQEAFFRRSLVLAPEPEHCVVCSVKYHAPALLNPSTGELGEMAVYGPHPTLVGEIAEERQTNVFRISGCAGLVLHASEGDQESTLTLPKNSKTMDPAQYCLSCRAMLSQVRAGWAILDAYGERRTWPAENGAEYTIRDYTVTIADREVTVRGHIYD